MKRVVTVLIAALIATIAFTGCKPEQKAEYPVRDITDIVVWGAGGGTDQCNRVIMAEMAKELGVNVNVTNVPGGVAGSAGMLEAYGKESDGYTLCGLSESCVTAAVQGGWDKKFDVWYPFNIGGSPDVISVGANSKYQTLEELVAAAKAAPGTIKAGASGAGSIHHLNLLGVEKGAEIKFNFIPYKGSAPSQNAAITGEIEVIVTSIAEQSQLIRSGELRPLGMLIPDSFTIDGKEINSAFETVPGLSDYLPLMQAIGFAIKDDAPDEVKQKLVTAFQAAMKSDAVRKFGEENFYVLSGAYGDEAKKIFAGLESNFSWTLQDLGMAKVHPDQIGISKP